MSANTLLTSVVTGGTNSHATVSEEANAYATDFVTQGVVGAIALNTGSAGTGSFCVNADASPDMGVTIKAGQAYVTATPSGQNSQVLRIRASSDYTAYTINANSSGSTKYDWIYLSISAANANTPSSDASNVASFVTSRSSSNATDNGSPPTYGLLLAVVTVANGASSITNSNITDKRFNTSIGAQNGSLIVTQSSTGQDAIVQAAGTDSNIAIAVDSKGTGSVKLNSGTSGVLANGNRVWTYLGSSSATSDQGSITSVVDLTNLAVTITVPTNATTVKILGLVRSGNGTTDQVNNVYIFDGSTQLSADSGLSRSGGASYTHQPMYVGTLSAGSHTIKLRADTGGGTMTTKASSTAPAMLIVDCC